MKLTQKRSAIMFFSGAGISVPSELFPPLPINQPIVAKPFHNVSATGHSLYPQILNGQTHLEGFMASQDSPDYFYQEYVKGESLYLLFYLSQKEGCDFTWSQRNLIQQPGGKSMLLAEPSSFHDSETAARIVEALRDANFNGLGMVEFIRAHDRDILDRKSTRLWGTDKFVLYQPK